MGAIVYKKIIEKLDLQPLPQVVVRSGTCQGTQLLDGSPENWALLGTTVAPSFDFSDFELGSNEILSKRYPSHKDLILQYTNN